jgi:hypothetical protein
MRGANLLLPSLGSSSIWNCLGRSVRQNIFRSAPVRRLTNDKYIRNTDTGFQHSMPADCFKTAYKSAFVELQKQQNYDWSITIGIGACPPNEEVLKRLTMIDAILSKKYLVGRYHKLPLIDRFLTGVAFEGERSCGDRHAHILVRIPTPLKKCSRRMLLSGFPFELQFLWHKLNPSPDRVSWSPAWPRFKGEFQPIEFCSANVARTIYTVKRVQNAGQAGSRFEIIQPQQWHKFTNENLSVIKNRDRQKRAELCLA